MSKSDKKKNILAPNKEEDYLYFYMFLVIPFEFHECPSTIYMIVKIIFILIINFITFLYNQDMGVSFEWYYMFLVRL